MEFTGYVEDYRLRDLLRIGHKATILSGSHVHVLFPTLEHRTFSLLNKKFQVVVVDPKHLRDDVPRERCHQENYTLDYDMQVEVSNFLPGHTDIYADSMGLRKIHNHQVVWKAGIAYHSTDINNVKEIRDAK
jgi:hypothetical protein